MHIVISGNTESSAVVLDLLGTSGYSISSTLERISEQGASSNVYRGILQAENCCSCVAVKIVRTRAVLTKESGITFERELEALSTLRHSSIVPYLGFCKFGYYDYALVSPWVDGCNLETFLQSGRPISHRLSIIMDVANGLAYLHDTAQIVHGNIQPLNVIVSSSVHAVSSVRYDAPGLGDPSVSYVSYPSDLSGCSTRSLFCVRYAAPELLLDDPDFQLPRKTKATDLYAFGILVLEGVTEQVPWPELSYYSIASKVLRGETPPRPSSGSMSDDLWGICKSCWCTDPVLRPNARDLEQRLRRIIVRGEDAPRRTDHQNSIADSSHEIVTRASKWLTFKQMISRMVFADEADSTRRVRTTWQERIFGLATGTLWPARESDSQEERPAPQRGAGFDAGDSPGLWMPGAPKDGWYPVTPDRTARGDENGQLCAGRGGPGPARARMPEDADGQRQKSPAPGNG